MTFSLLSILALVTFICAYGLVMLEEVIELKKSKPVVLASGIIWLLVGILAAQNGASAEAAKAARESIMNYGELLLFLLVSITYVNVLEERRVFEALRARLVGAGFSFRRLYWILGLCTFALSVVLANMTTALAMGAVALGLGRGNAKFLTLACINIVVASNAGGAFCPFGDVTSLMIWQAGRLGFLAFFKLFIPALLSWLVPAALMALALPSGGPAVHAARASLKPGAMAVVVLFAATIFISVLMNTLLGLPPVAGMVLGLGLLQALAWFTQRRKDDLVLDSFREMQRIEWDTLLFFFGIMFSISGLAHLGWLALANTALYAGLPPTVANILVGPLSAVLDNVPLVYAVLQMNPQMGESQWLLLALTAGVGGSMLSIGSSAGIALMGLAGKDYTFGKHLRWLPAIALGFAAAVGAQLALN
ncbi:MAG: sodium:proton antiporter NhaD [Alphaproteobacteria bacterium]|nr:sodium:proton antiporter NhaD [Alphaproteobacteria bacterium]